MKFTIDVSEFKTKLGLVSRVIGRSTLPVLDNVLLNVYGSNLSISGTNLATAITVDSVINNETGDNWSITIPHKTLKDLVSVRPTDKPVRVRFNEDDQSITLSQGRWRSKLKGIDASEFPLLPKYNDLKDQSIMHFAVAGIDFYEVMSTVEFARETGGTRPVLNGVNLFVNSLEKLGLQATDGFRLSYTETDIIPTVTGSVRSVLLGNHFIEPLAPFIKVCEDDLVFVFTETQVAVGGDDWLVIGQLDTNSSYPDTAPIIPVTSSSTFKISKADLSTVLKTMVVYAREASYTAKFEVGTDTVKISAKASEYGDSSEEVVCGGTPQPAEFAVNIKYLQDVVNVAGDVIEFNVNSNMEPILIKENLTKWVIMPMHFGN